MVSMEAALRTDDRVPDPNTLGPAYRDNFLAYLKLNPHMNIICFGLNCASPEDLIASLNGMFTKKKPVKAESAYIELKFRMYVMERIFNLSC